MRSNRRVATRTGLLLGVLATSTRRRLVLAVLAVTLVATLGVPGIAGAQAPGQDSVIGSLTQGFGFPTTTFTINAFSGPTGEQPGGTVLARSVVPGNADLDVTCLQVTGTRAVIGARVESPPNFLQYYLIIVDAPAGEPDRISFSLFFNDPRAPATCAAADNGATPNPARSGSVVVTDAQPLPTTKAQCKHGGWIQFGFKNQGQCVAFVQRGPQP